MLDTEKERERKEKKEKKGRKRERERERKKKREREKRGDTGREANSGKEGYPTAPECQTRSSRPADSLQCNDNDEVF